VDIEKPTSFMANFVNALPEGISPMSQKEDYEEAYNKSGYKISLTRVIGMF
jgi:hypothetical protein